MDTCSASACLPFNTLVLYYPAGATEITPVFDGVRDA